VTCIYLPNIIQIKPPRRSYDVISIYQDSGHSVANLIPVACLVLALVWYISIHGWLITISGFSKQYGPKNSKRRSRDPFTTPFDVILHFFSIVPPVINLSAKFDANIFISDQPLFNGFANLTAKCLFPPISGRFFWGELTPWNEVRYCRDPQKAHPWPKTRVLAYRSSRSVNKCDLWLVLWLI